jgi:thioredoxin 1
MAGENVIVVSPENWQAEILDAEVPVVVDFWAEWCGPCKAIAPALDQIADEMSGRLKVAKVNVDENPQIAAEFEIRSIPTLLVFKGGIVQEQMMGAMSKAALTDKLQPYI